MIIVGLAPTNSIYKLRTSACDRGPSRIYPEERHYLLLAMQNTILMIELQTQQEIGNGTQDLQNIDLVTYTSFVEKYC